ncbi:hypothetical protein B7494_g66 [Chlorociboria aeruginascens]|nr:hypothetical protein B7494_g66 [Chlorociboria aeruginascens]
MAGSSSRNASPIRRLADDDSTIISTRGLEAFGRKVTTTAGHLMGPLSDPTASTHYQNAMSDLHKQLRRPNLQRSVFSFAKTSPTDLVRSKLSTSEIQYRALTFLPDELLANIPDDENTYSLFQGFQATFPESNHEGKHHKRRISRGRKLIEENGSEPDGHPSLAKLKREKNSLTHQFEMLGIRKNMASSEIHEIDNKIANLNSMRRIVLDRLAGLEQQEALLEHDLLDAENRIEEAQEELDEAEALGQMTPKAGDDEVVADAMDASFMSESIYEKLPAVITPPRPKRHKTIRRKSMPILHEHFEPGSMIREIQTHNDMITALDFDVPFGTMVTSALDDSVRVWDLNVGRCMGLLEGHTASVRTLQMEDNIAATGSMDATIRLWDLSKARYEPHDNRINKEDDEDPLAFGGPEEDEQINIPLGTMIDCPLFTLEAHVDEVTALYFRGDTLISGSADKTLRQWDLEKGRCVQTLDVMWAAAQASATMGSNEGTWRHTGKTADSSANFVGAVQVFDAALACGTADGMVRLWDLRSGQVHRSLVGHTGPVTCLQFDDVHLVTGSMDRSIRIWDLRTGAIYDAYAYDAPVTSMMFDNRRIVAAAQEDVAKVHLDMLDTHRKGDILKNFMGACDQKTSEAILDHFYEAGGNFIDTSNNYQAEQSEQWIGEWVKKRGNRDQLILATKFTTNFRAGHEDKEILINATGNGAKSLHVSVEASLRKLQTSYIDLLYVHWWDYTCSIPELMQSLNHLVISGKVLYLGVSDTPAWIVSKANEYARQNGLRQFSVYQGQWSAAARDFERDIIPMCQAEGMGLAPWGALGRGHFKTDEQRKNDEGRNIGPAPEEYIKVSKALEGIANKKNTGITSIALAYVMHKTPYVFPIVGCRTVEHLKGNIEALTVELSAEEIQEIESATPFDIGFPQSFLGGPGGVKSPTDIWLMTNAGYQQHVEGPKPIAPPKV